MRSSIGASNRSVAGDLEMPKVPVQPSPPPKPKAAEIFQPTQTPPKSRPPPVQQPIVVPPKQPQAPMALDANSNATEPSLPVVPSKPAKPIEPDPLVQMFPKNIPHWFIITYTYSVA